jgi:hypothetical protein
MSAFFGWRGLTVVVALGMGGISAGALAGGDNYAPSAYPENYNSGEFFPAVEIRALPTAAAQAAAAQAQFRRAESDLNNAVADVRRTFDRSLELRDAMANERDAYATLVAARENAIADVKTDSIYKTMTSLKQRIAQQIETQSESWPQDALVARATLKLSYSATATAMEVAAMTADPNVSEARERLVAAGHRVAELHEQFDDAVHNSPAVLAARKNVEDARIAAVASDAFYLEARNVANVSMDWAYYLRQHPYPQSVYSPDYATGYPQFGYPINWWQGPAMQRPALPRGR